MKANQITAISTVVIALGVVYTIADNFYKEQQRIEFQKQSAIQLKEEEKKRRNFKMVNNSCLETWGDGKIKQHLKSDYQPLKKAAQSELVNCMEYSGYKNVKCYSDGEMFIYRMGLLGSF